MGSPGVGHHASQYLPVEGLWQRRCVNKRRLCQSGEHILWEKIQRAWHAEDRKTKAVGMGLLPAPTTVGEELCRLKDTAGTSTSGVKWLQRGRLDTRRWLQPCRAGDSSGLHVLMGTGAEGLGSSTALWKMVQGLVSGRDGTWQSLRHLPSLMPTSLPSSSCCFLPREGEGHGMVMIAGPRLPQLPVVLSR